LETIELLFGVTIAPGKLDCIFNGINIPVQNYGKTHDCREFGVNGTVDPFIQRLRTLISPSKVGAFVGQD